MLLTLTLTVTAMFTASKYYTDCSLHIMAISSPLCTAATAVTPLLLQTDGRISAPAILTNMLPEYQ